MITRQELNKGHLEILLINAFKDLIKAVIKIISLLLAFL